MTAPREVVARAGHEAVARAGDGGGSAPGSGAAATPRPADLPPPGNPGPGRAGVPPWPPWDAGPALYVHVPFCRHRCHYCDFNTYLLDGDLKRRYLAALERELAMLAADPLLRSRPLVSVFVGGGTPSLLEPGDIGRLLGAVHTHFRLAPGAEITVECNPGTLDAGRLAALREGGVNRISLGLQAVQDRLLRVIGRDHSFRDFLEAYEMVRRAGFDNVNVDLIFGLPGQSLADWERSLDTVAGLAPEHVSCYGLELHEGTPFHRWWREGRLALPGEDVERAMFDLARERLAAAGYEAYEISNFARAGFRSVHNQVYWQNGSYLGAGPGAWSYWRGERRRNRLHPAAYAAEVMAGRLPVDQREAVDPDLERRETMILGLRMTEGVDCDRFAERLGITPEEAFPEEIAGLLRDGWLVREGGRLRLSEAAIPVANSVLERFV